MGPTESGGLDTGKGPGAAALRSAFPAAAGAAQAGILANKRRGPSGRGLGAARPGQQGTKWMWQPHRRREVRGCGDREAATYAGHLPLDVLEELLLAAQEAGVLELGVVPLRLDQAALLDVNHLPEAICTRWGTGSSALRLGPTPPPPLAQTAISEFLPAVAGQSGLSPSVPTETCPLDLRFRLMRTVCPQVCWLHATPWRRGTGTRWLHPHHRQGHCWCPLPPPPPAAGGHSHMLSCRTKLAMLLCLKYLGSTSLANWPWSYTWKLFPLCQETCRQVKHSR